MPGRRAGIYRRHAQRGLPVRDPDRCPLRAQASAWVLFICWFNIEAGGSRAELQSPTEQQRPPTLGIRAPLHPALPTPTAGCALRLAQRICLLSDLPPLWPFPLHRVRTVLAAEALPFELFRNIKTQEEARQERAEGRAGLDDVVDDNLG